MKIGAISKQNYFSYNKNIKTKQITFGHYLDDEKYNKEQRLSSLESQIANVNSRIWSNEYDFNRQTDSLDNEIASAENDLEESENKVSKLKRRVDDKEYDIYELENEGNRLEKKAENNNKTIKLLENEKKKKIEEIKQSNNELQQKLTADFQTTCSNLRNEHETSLQNAVNGIKSSLIKTIINPIMQSNEGNDIKIPSSIYIEDDTNVSEPLFSWLVKQTDSNYVKFNTVNLQDEKQFTSLIKKISILAAKKYEETGTRTFTLLDDINLSFISPKSDNFFKDLLINSEKLYHNILVSVSNIPYTEISKINKFDINVKVDKNFLTDLKLGRNSFAEFISKHQYLGEDLLSKVIKK